MNRTKKPMRLAAALLAAALLSGCGPQSEQPVLNPEQTTHATAHTAPAVSSAPTPEPTAQAGTPEPSHPRANRPQWQYPLAAGALFGGRGLPEDFLFPLRLWEDGSQFLFATTDGRVLRARWDGVAYTAEPVAEQLDTVGLSAAFVDSARQWLFALAEKRTGNKTIRSIVMVNLATTARCDLCDMVGWQADGVALTREFQYAGGVVLARLMDQGSEAGLARWVLVDAAKKTCSTIDLEGFAAQHLSQWQQASAARLIALGGDRFLSVWAVRGAIQTDNRVIDETQAVAFVLDRSGAVVSALGVIKAAGSGQPAITGGTGFTPSADGRLVAFGGADGGVWLYDSQTNTEQAVEGGKARLTFAQWSDDGSLLYGIGSGQSAAAHRLSATSGGAASPQPTATASAQ